MGSYRDGGGRLRVLVIEDNPDAAESLATVLSLYGHAVEMALNGADGLNLARTFRPDVVLCDLGLPGTLDGLGVAEAMRRDPALRAARLIALTGYCGPEDIQRALLAGFDRHVTKPADPEQLISVLRP